MGLHRLVRPGAARGRRPRARCGGNASSAGCTWPASSLLFFFLLLLLLLLPPLCDILAQAYPAQGAWRALLILSSTLHFFLTCLSRVPKDAGRDCVGSAQGISEASLAEPSGRRRSAQPCQRTGRSSSSLLGTIPTCCCGPRGSLNIGATPWI
ncbi:unnamed protein product [Prorocentrum cordatum]|uniref:Uncharacterized protein n=1 Tax=Prorocentrum cordatum TaxID=2364126 RepID=A0ABN9TGR2_9DINO|nr:unnamed protein product [Polarella glacialis]